MGRNWRGSDQLEIEKKGNGMTVRQGLIVEAAGWTAEVVMLSQGMYTIGVMRPDGRGNLAHMTVPAEDLAEANGLAMVMLARHISEEAAALGAAVTELRRICLEHGSDRVKAEWAQYLGVGHG